MRYLYCKQQHKYKLRSGKDISKGLWSKTFIGNITEFQMGHKLLKFCNKLSRYLMDFLLKRNVSVFGL